MISDEEFRNLSRNLTMSNRVIYDNLKIYEGNVVIYCVVLKTTKNLLREIQNHIKEKYDIEGMVLLPRIDKKSRHCYGYRFVIHFKEEYYKNIFIMENF